MSSDSDFGVFLAGFAIGGLVGASVALLLAPQSGEDTRKFIQDKSIELKTSAAETAEQTRTKAIEVAHQAREKASSVAADAKVKTGELTDKAKEGAQVIKKRSQEVFTEQRGKVTRAIEVGKEKLQKKADDISAEAGDAEPTEA